MKKHLIREFEKHNFQYLTTGILKDYKSYLRKVTPTTILLPSIAMETKFVIS